MKKQSLDDEVKFASADLDEVKISLATIAEAKATAEGDLVVTTKSLNEDKADLAVVHQYCMDKAQTYELDVSSRGEELQALATSKKLLVEAVPGSQICTGRFFH